LPGAVDPDGDHAQDPPHASPRRVVQIGFLALFAGIVIMVAALEVGAGPEIVTWPMLSRALASARWPPSSAA
jgi:hypothetical protein